MMFDDQVMVGDCGDLDGIAAGWWLEYRPRWVEGVIQTTFDTLCGYLGIPTVDLEFSNSAE